MLKLDFKNSAIGNAMSIALGVKGIVFVQTDGLCDQHDAACVLVQDQTVILGEAACLLVLEENIPTPSFFPNGNKGMPIALSHWRDRMFEQNDETTLKAQVGLVMRQMDDGRDFLQGPNVALADIHSAAWVMDKPAVHGVAGVAAWLDRMIALRDGPTRQADKFIVSSGEGLLLSNGETTISPLDI